MFNIKSILVFVFFIIHFLMPFNAKSQSKKIVYIRGSVQNFSPTDTMTLRLYDHYFTEITNSATTYKDLKSLIDQSGHFSFRIDDVGEPKYFQLGKDYYNGRLYWLFSEPFIMEAGDSVFIKVGKVIPKDWKNGRIDSFMWANSISRIDFSGKGSGKYKCLYDITTDSEDIGIKSKIQSMRIPAIKFESDSIMWLHNYASFPDQLFRLIAFTNYQTSIQLKILERYKYQVSSVVLSVIKNNIIAKNEDELLRSFRILEANFGDYISDSLKLAIQADMQNIFSNRGSFLNQIEKNSYLKFCYRYNDFIVNSLINSLGFMAYESILSNYTGIVRDQLLTSYFLLYNRHTGSDTLDMQLNKALALVKTSYCSEVLSQIDLLAVNKPAFDFELPDIDGKIVRLKDFRGKVVFIDFWYTGCTNCAYYYQDILLKAEEHFRDNKDVVFITISVDGIKDKWMKSVKEGYYTGNESINLYTAGLGREHPVIKHYFVSGYPRPLLIGRSGKIVSKNHKELRGGGTAGLISTIEKVLSIN